MTSQVLARKWRPRGFDTLVGQEHVVRALTHALDQGRLHHAYLFTGTRGVGKTTLARILAKALNCEEGVSSRPCGVCAACREIDAGRFVDLLEVDAATNTGVDDVRALQDNAAYAPTRGRYKVFVIDEVHMLSKPAFNAMLKTLEEPPEHIKFILATTDPQKIPVTVLSRCLQFNLKNMSQPSIVGHLERVLGEEGIAAETGALRLIARAASGSMRDALSLLDQAIAHGAGQVAEAGVRDMLGTVGADALFAVLDAVLCQDVPAALGEADAMAARSLSLEHALQEMASILHRIALAQFAPDAVASDADAARLLEMAARFDPEYLQLCYQIALQARHDLPMAPDDLAGFTMALLRMVAFAPTTGGTSDGGGGRSAPAPAAGRSAPGAPRLAGRPSAAESLSTGGVAREADAGLAVADAVSGSSKEGAPRGASLLAFRAPPSRMPDQSRSPGSVSVIGSGGAAVARRVPQEVPPWEDMPDDWAPAPQVPPPETRVEPDRHLAEAHVELCPIAVPAPVPAPGAGAPDPSTALDEWHQLVRSLQLRGMPRELANHCDLVALEGGRVALRLAPVHKPLLSAGNQDKLAQALGQALGRTVSVAIELAEPQGETLAQRLRTEDRERRDAAIQAIEGDPFVQELINLFDAELNESSIRPL